MVNELKFIHFFYQILPDNGLKRLFLIDGRKYSSLEEIQRDIKEAWREMEAREIAIEMEVRNIELHTLEYDIPTWKDFKKMLKA